MWKFWDFLSTRSPTMHICTYVCVCVLPRLFHLIILSSHFLRRTKTYIHAKCNRKSFSQLFGSRSFACGHERKATVHYSLAWLGCLSMCVHTYYSVCMVCAKILFCIKARPGGDEVKNLIWFYPVNKEKYGISVKSFCWTINSSLIRYNAKMIL